MRVCCHQGTVTMGGAQTDSEAASPAPVLRQHRCKDCVHTTEECLNHKGLTCGRYKALHMVSIRMPHC